MVGEAGCDARRPAAWKDPLALQARPRWRRIGRRVVPSTSPPSRRSCGRLGRQGVGAAREPGRRLETLARSSRTAQLVVLTMRARHRRRGRAGQKPCGPVPVVACCYDKGAVGSPASKSYGSLVPVPPGTTSLIAPRVGVGAALPRRARQQKPVRAVPASGRSAAVPAWTASLRLEWRRPAPVRPCATATRTRKRSGSSPAVPYGAAAQADRRRDRLVYDRCRGRAGVSAPVVFAGGFDFAGAEASIRGRGGGVEVSPPRHLGRQNRSGRRDRGRSASASETTARTVGGWRSRRGRLDGLSWPT